VGGATAQWVTRRSGAWVSPLKVMVRKRGGGGERGRRSGFFKYGGKRATDEEEERIYLRLNTVHPLYPLSLVCFLWSFGRTTFNVSDSARSPSSSRSYLSQSTCLNRQVQLLQSQQVFRPCPSLPHLRAYLRQILLSSFFIKAPTWSPK
jgi:hypothetical protein